MAVEGLLGFRAMQWKDGGSKITSPQAQDYEWSEKIQWAKCGCRRYSYLTPSGAHKTITPPYDPEDFPDWPEEILLMEPERNCGIWASYSFDIVHKYYSNWDTRSVLFLCEALGSIYEYEEGWRASGVEIIATVIPPSYEKDAKDIRNGKWEPTVLRHTGAAKYLGIRYWPYETAVRAIQIQREKYEGDQYVHSSDKSPYAELEQLS